MAASLVVSIPVVVAFLLLQRFLVSGLTAGAVK
jgi:multiple sugar transport system permease protein